MPRLGVKWDELENLRRRKLKHRRKNMPFFLETQVVRLVIGQWGLVTWERTNTYGPVCLCVLKAFLKKFENFLFFY
jgi:hypothetical protein